VTNQDDISPILAAANEYNLFVTNVIGLKEIMKSETMALAESWIRNEPGNWAEYVHRITEERIQAFQDDLKNVGIGSAERNGC